MVVYVCFLKNATEETVDKLAEHLINARLFRSKTGRGCMSVCEVQGDILIVPQSTIGGKLKGKSFQYHLNIEKADGMPLYHKLCQQVRSSVEKIYGGNVKCGMYGTKELLTIESNGPFTHMIEV